ncbi:endonuclease [Chiayiivirga flava]|uniref:Endonuclease I n=1 Tax=Chiayiivirga flava TaxID=659595 RepID=A0A7W8D6H1_9GAMM|nr:endonuclease [Chiayiivirga flava]MBB5208814.1 endonuclease I [Chiayiivirga flava]
MMHRSLRSAAGAAFWIAMGTANADVFINELHYDNVGTDSNEKIEIIAPAGTNLAGWKIVLYNGSGGATYATYTLSGTTTNQCGGHGTAVVTVPASPGLQNGGPDGLALVDASNAVVQFLSYEGTFTASNGPAAGMTSSAIAQSETTDTPVGHSLRLTGTGTAYSQFTWAAPAASSFGACNPGQTLSGGGGGGGNVLVNGVPVSGLGAATNAALNYTIVVPSGAGNLVVATSGGSGDADLYVRHGTAPTTSTFDCRPYLSGNNETCTFASPASGTWHVMVRAYSAFSGVTLAGSYTSGGGDSAPTVVSTVPASGASNVAVDSNLVVTFSEPVTAGSGAFGLACGASGTHAVVRSGGPTTFTLNPSIDFGPLETCTLTIVASQVLDQDGTPTALAGNVVRSFTTIGSGSGYYGAVNTGSAAALRSSLHPVIDDHVRFPYTGSGTDTWDVLAVADQDPMNASRVLDIYRNASLAKQTGGNDFYNREHTWPNSLGFPNDVASNSAYTDLHMLMVSDIGYNSARGNKPYDNCNASCTEYPTAATNGAGGGSGTYPGNSNWGNSSVFQVWHKFKGNVARAMFYMDLRYEGGTNAVTGTSEPDLRLTSDLSLVVGTGGNASVAYMGKLSTLLLWHQQDPVDTAEQLRNEVVYSYQGNRNPFVDHPEWVACIYGGVCN